MGRIRVPRREFCLWLEGETKELRRVARGGRDRDRFLVVVNIGLESKSKVTIVLPAAGRVTDAATGKLLVAKGGSLRMSFYPCELRALHVQ